MKNNARDAIRDASRKWLLGERDETTHYDKPSSRLAHQIIGVLARLEEKGIVKITHPEDDAGAEMLEALKGSTLWVAKLIADRPDIDPTGVKGRAKRHLERLQDIITKAEGQG